ncbi:MAG: hypothetical protein NUV56_04455 [Candidatus Uhrbacteria bacterium]|nr:hypothetical protein [Candidatus Uhrbacteria bacterium]
MEVLPVFMFFLLACQDDHYLTRTVDRDVPDDTVDSAAQVVEPTCDGPMIVSAPETLHFLSIINPFDIDLATDRESVKITSSCDADLSIVITIEGGSVGTFALMAEGCDDVRPDGTATCTIAAYDTASYDVTYTATERSDTIQYDYGALGAEVMLGEEAVHRASTTLDATVINVMP